MILKDVLSFLSCLSQFLVDQINIFTEVQKRIDILPQIDRDSSVWTRDGNSNVWLRLFLARWREMVGKRLSSSQNGLVEIGFEFKNLGLESFLADITTALSIENLKIKKIKFVKSRWEYGNKLSIFLWVETEYSFFLDQIDWIHYVPSLLS